MPCRRRLVTPDGGFPTPACSGGRDSGAGGIATASGLRRHLVGNSRDDARRPPLGTMMWWRGPPAWRPATGVRTGAAVLALGMASSLIRKRAVISVPRRSDMTARAGRWVRRSHPARRTAFVTNLDGGRRRPARHSGSSTPCARRSAPEPDAEGRLTWSASWC